MFLTLLRQCRNNWKRQNNSSAHINNEERLLTQTAYTRAARLTSSNVQTRRSLFHDGVSNLHRASFETTKRNAQTPSCGAQSRIRDSEHKVTREATVLKHTSAATRARLRKRRHCGLMFSLPCRAADCLARTHLPDPIGLVLLKSSPQGEEYSVVISSTISGLPQPPPLRSINSSSSGRLLHFHR